MLLPVLISLLQAIPPHLEYSVEVSPSEDASPTVIMALQMQGDADGETLIQLPSSWGGENELWRGIEDIRVDGGQFVLDPNEDPATRTIIHSPNAPLTLIWHVVQDRVGGPTAAADDNYRPWIQREYVHLLGPTVFITPDFQTGFTASVTIEIPEEWSLASDLTHGDLTEESLKRSVLFAGEFEVMELDIEGSLVRIAVREGMDAELIRDATVNAVRANLLYWEAEGEPYLVTGLPIETESGRSSFGGTNLGDAFALFGTENTPEDILRRILVHEHAHTWVPGRVGGLTQGDDQRTEYWFSEGFADFVTTRAGLLSGAWSSEQALTMTNEFLAEYMVSPVREAQNWEIRDGFWSDPDLQRLPYLRGNLFALMVDHLIRTETNGAQDLDDVLHAMHEGNVDEPAAKQFVETVFVVTGLDISQLHQRHIVDGELIQLPSDIFGVCAQVLTEQVPVFVYGMEGARDDQGLFVIQSVDREGPAYAAGFRADMTLLERIGGSYGDGSEDSVFRVLFDGEEQVMSYRPTNGESRLVQRIEISAEGVDSAACRSLLSGRFIQ